MNSSVKTFQTDSDGHFDFIKNYDDPNKRHGICTALELAQDQAKLGLSWSFELLCSWIVLIDPNVPPVFRTTIVYDGLEYYSYSPEIETKFVRLIHDETDALHFIERACKAYLDICFFHPFIDGNSRLARVDYYFILFKNGYKLMSAEAARAIFTTSKYASSSYLLITMMDMTKFAITVR